MIMLDRQISNTWFQILPFLFFISFFIFVEGAVKINVSVFIPNYGELQLHILQIFNIALNTPNSQMNNNQNNCQKYAMYSYS